MPNFSPTVGTIQISGGATSFIPLRFSPGAAQVRITGGATSFSVGSDPSATSTVPDLDRLTQFDQLFNEDGTPKVRLISIWQDMCEKIEQAFTNQAQDISDLASIFARLSAAKAQAESAVTTAATTESRVNLASSYINPTNVLTASSSGVITIAAHTRYYGDGTSMSVNGGSVSGFASGSVVTVYYADAGRAGGTVTYQGATDAVAQAGSTHTVGVVTIPAAGAADSSGTGVVAPGVPYTPDLGTKGYLNIL